MTRHPVERQRIGGAAVDEDLAVGAHGREVSRQRDAGAYGGIETAMRHHHLVSALPVGGHRRVGDGQAVDGRVRYDVHQRVDDALSAYQMVERRRIVGERPHLAFVHRLHPLAVGLKMACGIHARYQGTHRRSGDGADVIAACLQFLDGADMSQTTGAATRQHQCHVFLVAAYVAHHEVLHFREHLHQRVFLFLVHHI